MDYILVIGILLALAIEDIRNKEVSVPLLVCFVVVSLVTRIGIDNAISPRVLLGVLPGVCLIILALLSKKIGIGDGVVVIGIGVATGLMKSIVIFAASVALCAAAGAFVMAIKKKKRGVSLPLIPFLFASTTLWVLV